MPESHQATNAALSKAEILGCVAEEFFQMLDRGEQPDLDQLAQCHPEVAEAIRQVLPALSLLDGSQWSALGGPSQAEEEGPRPKLLGDFRLGRELGRGGMGVVYEAEQISMGRTVALKVLPFAAVLDDKAITRFKNEARAAGTLHHDNIVPVHAVGNERGVYYYAMALIEGLTLAQVIEEQKHRVLAHAPVAERLLVDQVVFEKKPSPDEEAPLPTGSTVQSRGVSAASSTVSNEETMRLVQGAISTHRSVFGTRFFQQVVQIGIQAADALDHAHEHGIVHRDIKPGNLIIDPTGKVWVTDFGLARIETDAGMTMTGDVLGTLRYMAPEQALAKRIVVDHRADIYSLGVTLYELLTLRPVYDGADRETLFKQLTFEEPKPVREFQPGIPADLETIVLKAIAKSPDERYATAMEMAEDLRAFQRGTPILARRPSLADRVVKWTRRHPSLVTSVVVILLATVTTLGTAIIMVSREKNVTAEALRQKAVALGEAEQYLIESRKAQAQAEDSLSVAMGTIDDIYSEFATVWLSTESAPSTVQQAFLNKAVGYYESIIRSQQGEALDPYLAGLARERIGEVRIYLEEYDDAVPVLQESVDLARDLCSRLPDDPTHQEALMRRCYLLSKALAASARFKESNSAIGEALKIAELRIGAQGKSAERQYDLADYRLQQLRLMIEEGQLSDAEQLAQKVRKQGIDLQKEDEEAIQPDVIRLNANYALASIKLRLHDLPTAERLCVATLRRCRTLRSRYLNDAKSLIGLETILLVQLGDIARAQRNYDDAAKYYRTALDLKRQTLVAKLRPSTVVDADKDGVSVDGNIEPGPFCGYVEIQLRLADVLMKADKPYQAELVLGECVAVVDEIGLLRPYSLRYQVATANTWGKVAESLAAGGRTAELRSALVLAGKVWQDAVIRFPYAKAYRSGTYGSDNDLAWFEGTFPGQIAEAAGANLEAIRIAAFETHFFAHTTFYGFLRDGDWETAAMAYHSLTQMRTVYSEYDHLYLALALAELGQLDESDRRYEQSMNIAAGKAPNEEYEIIRERTKKAIQSAEKNTPSSARGAFEFIRRFEDPVEGKLRRPRCLALDEKGMLYTTVSYSSSVARYRSKTGEYIDAFIPSGRGGLDNPMGILIHGNQLLVAGAFSDTVESFDIETGEHERTRSTPPGSRPRDVALDGNGKLYVTDKVHRVLRYDPISKQFDVFVAAGDGGLFDPRGLAFGADRNLYVASRSSHNVLKFDGTTGKSLGEFVKAGSGGLSNPVSLVFGDDGYLYVTSEGSNEVLRFDAKTGSFVDAAVSRGYGEIDAPYGLVVRGDRLFVIGRRSQGIYEYRLKLNDSPNVTDSPSVTDIPASDSN